MAIFCLLHHAKLHSARLAAEYTSLAAPRGYARIARVSVGSLL
jgi:hypothetical protein